MGPQAVLGLGPELWLSDAAVSPALRPPGCCHVGALHSWGCACPSESRRGWEGGLGGLTETLARETEWYGHGASPAVSLRWSLGSCVVLSAGVQASDPQLLPSPCCCALGWWLACPELLAVALRCCLDYTFPYL